MNQDPHRRSDKANQNTSFEDNFDSFDDFSLKKKVKPNEGEKSIEYYQNQRQDQKYPPQKPQIPLSIERKNYNYRNYNDQKRYPDQKPPNQKTQADLSEEFIPFPKEDTLDKERYIQRQNSQEREQRDWKKNPEENTSRNFYRQPNYRPQETELSIEKSHSKPSYSNYDQGEQGNWKKPSNIGDKQFYSQYRDEKTHNRSNYYQGLPQQRNFQERKDWEENPRNRNDSERKDFQGQYHRDDRNRGYEQKHTNYRDNKDDNYNSNNNYYSQRNYEKNRSNNRSNLYKPRFGDNLDEESNLLVQTKKLPIYPFKSEILQAISSDQVTIISGDTGCGKSTQIPKYILEDCIKKNKECRIICTQPRRIAAMTLAKRVQEEISEMFPGADPRTVGYHIGMETNFNRDSKIIFVTNGIFLQRFIHEDENTEGGILKNFTHAILDEIHERDIDSDFIMVALKHVLSKHPNFKLILMSATINAELFSKYFSKTEIEKVSNYYFDFTNNKKGSISAWDETAPKWEPVSSSNQWDYYEYNQERYKIDPKSTWGGEIVEKKTELKENVIEEEKDEFKEGQDQRARIIEINKSFIEGGQKFEIYTKYLDHLKRDFDIKCTLTIGDFSKKKAIFHDECIKVCKQLIAFLTSSKNQIESDIRSAINQEVQEGKRLTHYLPYMLIFLPGLSEIYHLMDLISADKSLTKDDLDLIPLHSTLSDFNQKKLFEKPAHSNQRKIILSTNIAESSITIPNVLYVIDFCLLKEINSTGRNNIEVLDLVWASKASIRQRAGRTGRVSDGYVFRLIPEYFYEKELDAFSKPELHRSPLDKLILRIKTLHESEKVAKKQESCLFTNPKEVLGRAIEPPQLESIALAARNLQDNGALTTVNEGQTNLGEITFLGKIFCDLPCDVKVSRMILLGLAFGLKEEIVSLAAILSQRKSLFRSDSKAVPRNRYAFMKNLWNAADGTHSDHIAILRTYVEWEKKFLATSVSVKQVRRMRENFAEREYCQEKQIDMTVLREIYIAKQDIITRLKKLEVLKEDNDLILDEGEVIKERKYFWEDPNLDQTKKNEKYAIIKFVLAGAFYITYIKPSDFKRQVDTTQSNYIKSNTEMDPLKTIVIRHTHRGVENWKAEQVKITKDNWFKMLKKFNPEEIKFIQDKAYILFGNENYEFAIKTLDYIKRSYYDISRQIAVYNKEYGSNIREELTFSHTTKNHSNIFYKHWMDPDCVALFDGLGEVEYYNAYEFVDFLTRKRIKIEADSINNVVPIKKSDYPVCLVTQEYFEKKSGILSAKYTTLLDPEYFECKFMLTLITMIFAPQISLESDEGKTRYKSMNIDGTEIDFEFYLTQKDIEEINEIRSLLQDFFLNTDRNNFQTTYFSLWQAVLDLLKKERIVYIPQEKWEDKFRQEYGDKLVKTGPEFQSKRIRKPAKQPTAKLVLEHYYLNPIKAKDLPNARFANSALGQEAAKESQKYYSLYMDWKKSKIIEIKKNLRLIDQKITYLACGVCGTKLCDFTCVGEEVVNGLYRHLRCSEFIFKTTPCSLQDKFFIDSQLDKIKNHQFLNRGVYVSHVVLGCYQNHELALRVSHRDFSKLNNEQVLKLLKRNSGIKMEEEYQDNSLAPLSSYSIIDNLYITKASQLILVFPDDTQEPFEFYKFNSKEMIIKNQEKLQERERKLQNLTCPICQIDRFETKEDFKNHTKTKQHNEEYRKFVDNLTEIPE